MDLKLLCNIKEKLLKDKQMQNFFIMEVTGGVELILKCSLHFWY